MTNIISEIFQPQTKFEGINNIEKLSKMFLSLYKIDLYKDGLDLILTKIDEQDLEFEVKIIKDWDTNVGCFLTQQNNFLDKTIGKIFKKQSLKIVLRQLSIDVLAHEMAHAVDFESKLNLNEDFRKAIGFDMKDRQPQILTLRALNQSVMIDALRKYPPNQFLSELFARYFELLSLSRDVSKNGDFSTQDVMNFFENTTNYIKNTLNPRIRTQINPEIARKTADLIKNVDFSANNEKFSEKVNSFHQKPSDLGSKSWSKNVRSNSSYQESWNKFKQIEDNKDS